MAISRETDPTVTNKMATDLFCVQFDGLSTVKCFHKKRFLRLCQLCETVQDCCHWRSDSWCGGDY